MLYFVIKNKRMKKLFLYLVFVLLFNDVSFAQTDIYDSVYSGGFWRKYMTHLPVGYNTQNTYPLILGFHGGQLGATSGLGWSVFAYQSKLSEKADSSGFIVVYPEGLVFNQNRSWNAGDCCPPAMNQATDDVGFVDDMLNQLFADYNIDTLRVYATGSSNGGMLCYRLACELSHRIAAIAPNACSHMFDPCNAINSVPIISFHSKADPIVFYQGGLGGAQPLTGIYFPSQDSVLNLWMQSNNCNTRDTIVNGNGTNYDFIKISNCSCNIEMHHYATSDGSHSWPGGNPNNNPVSIQISATDLLWDFFQNYTLGCTTTSTTTITNEPAIQLLFPNPFHDRLYHAPHSKKESFSLYNCYGQLIVDGENIEEHDFSYLRKGMYFIEIGNSMLKLIKE
jgi:polyhydroxybutyrate depolymerase